MATTSKPRTRKAAVKAFVTVAKFTDSSRPFSIVRSRTPLQEFIPIAGNEYVALGHNTPLRDAVAQFIAHLDHVKGPDVVTIGLLADESGSMHGKEDAVIQGVNDFVVGMQEVKKIDPATAGTVLAVITTDGMENASREITSPALQDLIAKKEANGYTFIFLGANIDAWGQGQSLGFSGSARGQTVSYSNTAAGASAALANVTTDASSYLANQGEYVMARSAMGSMRSVTEDGKETLANINAPTTNAPPAGGFPGAGSVPAWQSAVSSPYADVADALKRAKGATTEGSD